MENCMKTRPNDCVVKKMNLPYVWYILNKRQTHKWVGCISLLRTVAVLLLLFWRLSWKANLSGFLYGQAVTVKAWKVLFVVVNTTVLTCSELIALPITLIFLFNWFLVTFSLIHTCLAPLSTIILCQLESSREAL